MTESVVVDSYAWVEYSEGSDEGRSAREYIEGDYELYTPAVVVAELSDRATREGMRGKWEKELRPFLERQTTVVQLDAETAGKAGKTKWEMRDHAPEDGLADAVVLTTAREHDAKVLTGDPDFLVEALSEEVVDVTAPD